MKGTIVYKMTGSGNDFVFVDGRSCRLEEWTPDRIRRVCDRHHGVGGDGFVVVEPGSSPNAVRFHFFNNDGGRAAMCGNGALCATRIAAYLEVGDADGMLLETDAGIYPSRCLPGEGELAEVVLGDLGPPSEPPVQLRGPGERQARLMLVGVPHLVVLVEQVGEVPLLERGKALRWDPALGPDGANVNFVSRDPGGRWTMRTYERGVEGETLACGTGAVAAGSVLALTGLARLPLEIATASGRTLRVAGAVNQAGIRKAALCGEGRLLFRAVLGEFLD
jgi:diaminopimelate epimerase